METLYIVMPAYNEELNIEGVIREWYPVLEGKCEDSRFVVNCSGSTDGTYEVLTRMQQELPKIHILTDSANSYGAKVLDLYHYAVDNESDWIFQTDSDGQTDPADFTAFWNDRHEYDAVIGNRSERQDGSVRVFVGKTVVRMISRYFKVDIPDANAPFRLIKTFLMDQYLEIIPHGYSMPNILLSAMLAVGREKLIFRNIFFGQRRGGKNTMDLRKIVKTGFETITVFSRLKRRFAKAGSGEITRYNILFFGLKDCIRIFSSRHFNKEAGKTDREFFAERSRRQYEKGNIEKAMKAAYLNHQNCHLELELPVTFCEKIQWLKLHDSTDLKTEYTDKYLAKQKIAETAGEQYIIPSYGVWDKAADIDFDFLPEEFALKTNHSCGTNLFARAGEEFDRDDAVNQLDEWMKQDYCFIGGCEMQYIPIKKKVFAEKCLPRFMRGSREYKFMCMDGEIACIFDFYWDPDIYTTTMYDENWNMLDWTPEREFPMAENPCEKPPKLEEMKAVARKLSRGFRFVRVDMYLVGEKVYVGEMTFTPHSGYCKFSTLSSDIALGRKIVLPWEEKQDLRK